MIINIFVECRFRMSGFGELRVDGISRKSELCDTEVLEVWWVSNVAPSIALALATATDILNSEWTLALFHIVLYMFYILFQIVSMILSEFLFPSIHHGFLDRLGVIGLFLLIFHRTLSGSSLATSHVKAARDTDG